MTRYFQMMDDVHVPGRWHLADLRDRNGRSLDWTFSEGKPVEVDQPMSVGFANDTEHGKPVEYSELAIESVPVVHVKVAAALVEHAPLDVQTFPVRIEGQPEQFCVVNIIRVVECIDERASRFVRRYGDTDGEVRLDRIGQYKDVRGMRISPDKVKDVKIFRPWGWLVAIVVAEEIKQALEQINTVGVKFVEV